MFPERHDKVWGVEYWIANHSYCGKKLILNKGFRCSLHYHPNKHETFYVLSGLVLLEVGDEAHLMYPNELMPVNRGVPHRFWGIETSTIFEFSTRHDDADSIRSNKSGEFSKRMLNARLRKAKLTVE